MKKICLMLIVTLLSFTLTIEAQTKKDTIGKYKWGSEKYPGADSGEVFLMVISTTFYYDYRTGVFLSCNDDDEFGLNMAIHENYRIIGWKTKRLGFIAYTPKGEILTHYRPVFVKKSELVKAGLLK